jgi:hypothetical protein
MNKIFIFFIIIFLLFLWLLKLSLTKNRKLENKNVHYFLATLTIAKNESMIIKEFIEHYKSQGVSHMFIIDNGSTDNMAEIIKPFIEEGFVTLYFFEEPYKQIHHYNEVYKKIKNKCDWLAVIDVDEYIFGVEDSIEELLKYDETFSNVDYIILPWIMFGSSGYENQPESIRKSFIKRKSLEECKSNPKFDNQKSLFRTKKVDTLNIHLHNILNKNDTVVIEAPINKLRLNHYAIMSWEYFSKVKMARGDAHSEQSNNVRDRTYFDIYDADTDIYDTALSDIYIYTKPSVENFYSLAEPNVVFQTEEPPTRLDIVVAYYNVSLDWLFEILKNMPRNMYRVFIYSKKNSIEIQMYDKYIHKLIDLKNIGRCDHTYIYHIIDNYDAQLSDTTLFIKDSALRHDNDANMDSRQWVIENIYNSFKNTLFFEGIGLKQNEFNLYNWIIDEYIQQHDQNNNKDPFITAPKFLRPIQNWAKNVLDDENFDISEIKTICYYGIFFFKSENIKLRPFKTWIRAGISLSLGPNLEIGHYMERFWYYFLTNKDHYKNYKILETSTNKIGL